MAVIAPLSFADGGYFSDSWGWPAIGLLLVAGVALVAGRGLAGRGLDAVFVGGLAGLLGWTLLSATWSESPWRAAVEGQRTAVYVAAAAAFLALTRGPTTRLVPWGLLVAATAPVAYGLATRLYPERLGEFDPIAGYRLAAPIGYWNGLGLLAAMTGVLAVALAGTARRPWAAAAAALPVPALAATLYFTFSRGAPVAFVVGLGAALLCSRAPLRLTLAALALAPGAAATIVLASRSEALTHTETALAAAADEGRRLALAILALSAASGLVAAAFALAAARLSPPRRLRLATGAALAGTAAAVAVAALVQLGGPVEAAQRGWAAFAQPAPKGVVDLNQRLRSFSGNGRADLWRVALDDWRDSPVAGSGAGTYERAWLRDERNTFKVRDAHSLYLEMLAELGPVGLGLLLVALGAPLVAAIRIRGGTVAAPLAGAYVTYLVHAAVDWDWELVALTLVAVVSGATLVAAARRDPPRPRPATRHVAVAAVALASGVLAVSLAGNRALARSGFALADGDTFVAADAARRSSAYLPWSPQPLTALGDAQLAAGLPAVARSTFRQAIARDPGEWRPWYGLALASTGRERQAALAKVRMLNRSLGLPQDGAP